MSRVDPWTADCSERGRRITVDLQLGGKVALVTGSTAGIGYAIAEALAREGARVYVNGRTPDRVDEAVARVRGAVSGADVAGVAADLGTSEGVARVAGELPEVDVLVNNVGIFEPKSFAEIPDEDWLRFFEVNVMSGVRLSRLYFPRMLERGWGRVVFISSESALQIPAEMIHYGMTKTAQLAVARGLAELTVGTGVTVNSVLPGPTNSEGVGDFVRDLAAAQGVTREELEKEFFRSARPSSLLRRFETPEEIAHVVAFVCSPLASSINGASVRADGGILRSIS
jgi:NAD(P)-dependent dehydrogenase (short-subunit alcohol dehydrogenase family)